MNATESHDYFAKRAALSTPIRKIVTGAVLFVSVLVFAVIGYVASGWRLDDSIYMVVITIFGVGYGEVQPVQSPALRLLTMVVIIGGYGAVIYTVGGFMQMVIDGELNKALGARRMKREIDQLTNHTIICGVGRMGSILAKELKQAGKAYVVIDTDERRLQTAEDLGALVINGDATEEHVLAEAGIKRASVLANVLSEDATNVFVTLTARGMNSDILIIARGENPKTEKKLLACGADKVVLPTAIGAKKLAMLITRPTAENLLEQATTESNLNDELAQIGLQFHEMEISEGSVLINKKLGDIEHRGNHGFIVVGLKRAEGSTELNPPADATLSKGDVVIMLGRGGELPQLVQKFTKKPDKITYRGVSWESN